MLLSLRLGRWVVEAAVTELRVRLEPPGGGLGFVAFVVARSVVEVLMTEMRERLAPNEGGLQHLAFVVVRLLSRWY